MSWFRRKPDSPPVLIDWVESGHQPADVDWRCITDLPLARRPVALSEPPAEDEPVLGWYFGGRVEVVRRGWVDQIGKGISAPRFWRPIPK